MSPRDDAHDAVVVLVVVENQLMVGIGPHGGPEPQDDPGACIPNDLFPAPAQHRAHALRDVKSALPRPSATLLVLVDFRQHRLGQSDDNRIDSEFGPRQVLKVPALEEQVRIRNDDVLHANPAAENGWNSSAYILYRRPAGSRQPDNMLLARRCGTGASA